MLSVNEIVAAVKLGAPLETIIPADSDPAFWQRLVDRALAAEAKPKRRRQSSRCATRTTTHRPSAAEGLARVQGYALAELVNRVNQQERSR